MSLFSSPCGAVLPAKWIEYNITKKECCAFIPLDHQEQFCQCGRTRKEHHEDIKIHHRSENIVWRPSEHTVSFPTDAYGTIIFEGELHQNKAHYVRISYDTSPELVVQLLTLVWGIPMPKLLISIRGGGQNFKLPNSLGKALQAGLIEAAKATDAWILTNGLNRGVSKQVGSLLSNQKLIGFNRGHLVSIGIALWGIVEHRKELVGRNHEKRYSLLEHPDSKFVPLNPRHSNFLLVDNGSVGRMGKENIFRKQFERCISNYPASASKGCDTPVVAVILEGGLNTLRCISEYLSSDPPVPVVLCNETGRTANLISHIMRRTSQGYECEQIKEEIYYWIAETYQANTVQCDMIFKLVKQIMERSNMITVYDEKLGDFDKVLLGSIFRSQHWSPLQQLFLALVWDRVDIAMEEVFDYGREWSRAHLEQAMMEALATNRIHFVQLLIEHGLNMQTFLTPSRLENLYCVTQPMSKIASTVTAEFIRLRIARKKQYHDCYGTLTLQDVGLVLSRTLGNIYKSTFVHEATKVIPTNGEEGEEQASFQTFPQPFDDLFTWAILTQRHELAMLLWPHGQGSLAKALVAIKINRYMASEMRNSERTDINLASELTEYAFLWEMLSYELLETCFRQDAKYARDLLTMELQHWSNQTCLALAVMANHQRFLGHMCCQMLLADLWLGALNISSWTSVKIILGILFLPIVTLWEFRPAQELQLLPQGENYYTSVDEDVVETRIKRNKLGAPSKYAKLDRSGFDPSNLVPSGTLLNSTNQEWDGANLSEMSSTYENFLYYDKPEMNTSMYHHRNAMRDKERQEWGVEVSHRNGFFWRKNLPLINQKINEEGGMSGVVTKKLDLSCYSKMYEFLDAPITKFYQHTISYCIFVGTLAHTILVPVDKSRASPPEIYVILYLATSGVDIIREFIMVEATTLYQKWLEFHFHRWQICDFFLISCFMMGVGLRFSDPFFEYGMLIYRTTSVYWILRLYKLMGVHKFIGPKLVMMGRMIKHMLYFVVIIFVIIMAFGITREAIKFPDESPNWKQVLEAFLEPYVMIFGEVDTEALSPQCGEQGQPLCPVGYWIVPILWAMYMMTSNILLVNVLIAVFNGIYAEINSYATELWMFQRFMFVMEYEGKPPFPPPLIIFCHIWSLIEWIWRQCSRCLMEQQLEASIVDDKGRIIVGNDHRLKTFLTTADQNRIFDFEEENLSMMTQGNILNIKDNWMIPNKEPRQMSWIGSKADKYKNLTNLNATDRMQQVFLRIIKDMEAEMDSQREKLDKILGYWDRTFDEASLQEHEDFVKHKNSELSQAQTQTTERKN